MEIVNIPNGCCELVIDIRNGEAKKNRFKVLRSLLDYEPMEGKSCTFFMKGSGFAYNGEIYHKNTEYAFIYIY